MFQQNFKDKNKERNIKKVTESQTAMVQEVLMRMFNPDLESLPGRGEMLQPATCTNRIIKCVMMQKLQEF